MIKSFSSVSLMTWTPVCQLRDLFLPKIVFIVLDCQPTKELQCNCMVNPATCAIVE